MQSRRNKRAATRFFRKLLKRQGREPRRLITDKLPRLATGGGKVAINRNLTLLRSCFNWAIHPGGYTTSTPFKIGPVTIVRRFPELARERRLEPGEEQRLLAACGPHLRAMVEAALETACRLGELLSLQWRQVRWTQNEIHLPGGKTKSSGRRRRDSWRATSPSITCRQSWGMPT